MLLYLMRHGIAVPRDTPDYPTDRERPLTQDGRKKTRDCVKGMRALKLRLDLVLTSSYQRAKQTAELVVEGLKLPLKALRTTSALEPGATRADVLREITAEDPTSSVLLVGHEPDLSSLIAHLIGHAAETPGNSEILMKRAALALVDLHSLQPERGTLQFLLQPSHLRALR